MRAALRQRIATAVPLALGLVGAILFLPPPALALLAGLAALIAAWEWSDLAGYRERWAKLAYVFAMVLVLVAVYRHCQLGGDPRLGAVRALLGIACLWWSVALLWVMHYPGSASLWGARPALAAMGPLVLVPAWLALLHLLNYPHGRWLLLYFFVLVAAADIGAYFCGRRFGRHRLAPAVSPSKSWEGVWGGLACCALLALLAWWLARPGQLGPAGALAVALVTALASVLGDLVESMVKRQRGVKDSGSMLPGHGGVLDRIDGHTAAAPAFALGLILAGW